MWAAVTLAAAWMFPKGMTVNPCFHQQHLMSRGWNRSHLAPDFRHVGIQTSSIASAGKGRCSPSLTHLPSTCLFPLSDPRSILTAPAWQMLYGALLISKAGREGSCPSRSSECGTSPCTSLTTLLSLYWETCTGNKRVKEIIFS